MSPRVLKRGPNYTLDVKTRVPTGQLSKTQQSNLTPAPDTSLTETFGFLGGLAELGYSLTGFFNQNNQRNADRNWNDILPNVQEDWNFLDTKNVDKMPELNKELLSKYQDSINSLDENQKVKDKMFTSLSDYSARKMEQLYGRGIAEDKTANIANLQVQLNSLIKNENLGGAIKIINDAASGEDAWLDETIANTLFLQTEKGVLFEVAKNDLAVMDYKTAYDTLQQTAVDEEGNLLKNENGDLVYLFKPGLSGEDRTILEQTITQAGTLEEKRASIAKTEASNEALNSLFNDEISIADFMKTNFDNLDTIDKTNLVNTYEGQQALVVKRLDSVAAEPLRKGINDGTITNPDTIRAIDDPDLTEKTRAELIRSLESGTKVVDPYKEALNTSKLRLDALMRKAAAGDEPIDLIRTALSLTVTPDDADFPPLFADDYNKFLADVQKKSALGKLTSIVSGAEKDPRFIDEKTGLQDPVMFDEFVRNYTELFYGQIDEEDPEKQMDIDVFRSMADTLIDTISNEKLQKEFRDVSVSNQNVGTGLLTSWNSNKMEDAVTSLNEGMYDAMKYIEPEAWSMFQRKLIDQYKLIKDDTADPYLRLYKDKIPVFTNKDGKEEMIIVIDGTPQVVSLDAGLDKYKNLALGYSVGDVNSRNETMLSTGWFNINNNSVDVFGSAYGGQIIKPKGEEEYYLMTDTLRGVVVRPFHGNPSSESDIAAAVKEASNPIVELNEDNQASNDVNNALKATAPKSYYPTFTPTRNPEVPLTPQQMAQDALKAGRF